MLAKTMTGPLDGRKVTYHFGPKNGSNRYTVKGARSLAAAVRAFRVGAVFPHQYSDGRIAEKRLGDRGYQETVYLSSKPGATIPVHVYVKGEGWVEIARIPPEGNESEFGPALLAVQGQLAVGSDVTALATATAATGLQTMARTDLEKRQLALEEAMGKLELQKRQLQEEAALMRDELKRRAEQIWMIELYLGSNEWVKQLRDGAPAPSTTPITVLQTVRAMDEELAVYDWFHHPERIGTFDWQNVEDFDDWLLADPAHLDAVFPHAKGIVGLRVRRLRKKRPVESVADVFANAEEDAADEETYLLVRNGERLYRLWIDVKLWPRLFPSLRDATPIDGGTWAKYDEKRRQEKMKTYLAGLLAVQGLIERSELLHPLPRPGVSVFDNDCADCFELVRDGEGQLALADGEDPLAHLSWSAYRRWLQRQLADGCRAVWVGTRSYSEDDRLYHRTYLRSLDVWPGEDQIVTIKADRNTWRGTEWSFLYLPDDDVFRPDPIYGGRRGEYVKRSRRVRFHAYSDELIPVDAISWRVLEHLIHDRNARPDYGRFFTLAFHWWHHHKAEASRERPFVDLVLSRAGVPLHDDAERARCERLVRWWKAKTKTHRTLEQDEAKALRMIGRAFARGDDHDNDPEKRLLEDVLGRREEP